MLQKSIGFKISPGGTTLVSFAEHDTQSTKMLPNLKVERNRFANYEGYEEIKERDEAAGNSSPP